MSEVDSVLMCAQEERCGAGHQADGDRHGGCGGRGAAGWAAGAVPERGGGARCAAQLLPARRADRLVPIIPVRT